MVLVDNPSEQPSALPPPLAPWPYSDDDDDSDDEDEDGETATRKKKEDDEPEGPQKWSLTMWRLWNPEGTPIAELPPVAAAALADAIAAAGQSPSLVIADLRAELAEGIDAGGLTEEAAAREEASIARLEAELCGGAVPADKCCKCRVHPRAECMVFCGHRTLCTSCERWVTRQANGDASRSKHLARLMCPICRGFEVESDAKADDLFKIVDRDGNGVIESNELLVHLLVAGQEADSISELFGQMDADADGVISKEEWRAGFKGFLKLATPASTPMPTPRGGPEPEAAAAPSDAPAAEKAREEASASA